MRAVNTPSFGSALVPTRRGCRSIRPTEIDYQPTASNLSFAAGQTIPDVVAVKLGGDGKIKLASDSAGTVQLIADVAGYHLAGTPTS